MRVFGALVLTCFPRVENLSTLVENRGLRFSSITQLKMKHQVQSEYRGIVLHWQRRSPHSKRGKWTIESWPRVARNGMLATSSMKGALQQVSSQYCKKVDATKSGASLTWLDNAADARCAYTMVGGCSTIADRANECFTVEPVAPAIVTWAAGLIIIDRPAGQFPSQSNEQGRSNNLSTAGPSEALQQCSSKNSFQNLSTRCVGTCGRARRVWARV